ncbi:hypothetical protein D3C81_1552540 [compost metagenome]
MISSDSAVFRSSGETISQASISSNRRRLGISVNPSRLVNRISCSFACSSCKPDSINWRCCSDNLINSRFTSFTTAQITTVEAITELILATYHPRVKRMPANSVSVTSISKASIATANHKCNIDHPLILLHTAIRAKKFKIHKTGPIPEVFSLR